MANDTIITMTAQLQAELGALLDPHRKQDAAKREAKAYGVKVEGVRWNAAHAIAKLSLDNQWSMSDLDEAAKAAVDAIGTNDKATRKTLEVFASQLKATARPRVRIVFATTARAINDAWAEEDQAIIDAAHADEKADTPIRNFVSRKFELLLRACREIHENKTGLMLTCVQDVIDWAIDNTNENDRAAKRIAAIVKSINDMNVEYHLDDLKLASEYLAGVKVEKLIAAKRALEAERATIATEHKALHVAAPPTPAVTERPLAPIPPVIAERIQAAAQAAADADDELDESVDEDESTLEGAFDPAEMDVAASSDFVDDAINNRVAVQLAA